jgi:PAS domain S-box-containing protein
VIGIRGADQTELWHNDSELVDLIDRYRLLVELSPDAIVVHESGHIRYANAAILRVLGKTEPEVIGHRLVDFIEPSERTSVGESIQLLTEPGMATQPAALTLLGADDARVRIESVSVRTTWEGRPAFQVIMRDVSERRRQGSPCERRPTWSKRSATPSSPPPSAYWPRVAMTCETTTSMARLLAVGRERPALGRWSMAGAIGPRRRYVGPATDSGCSPLGRRTDLAPDECVPA